MLSIITFIESIPALLKLVQLFVDKWQAYQYQKLLAKYDDKALKRTALINSIVKAESDEQRKALIVMLRDINDSK